MNRCSFCAGPLDQGTAVCPRCAKAVVTTPSGNELESVVQDAADTAPGPVQAGWLGRFAALQIEKPSSLWPAIKRGALLGFALLIVAAGLVELARNVPGGGRFSDILLRTFNAMVRAAEFSPVTATIGAVLFPALEIVLSALIHTIRGKKVSALPPHSALAKTDSLGGARVPDDESHVMEPPSRTTREQSE